MAKPSEKRRQKALQRKAAKRKKKRASSKPWLAGGRALLRAAGHWPLYECLLTKAWQKPEEIVQILVARRSPTGQIAAGGFLVDLGCLGVKNAFAVLFDSQREYKRELRAEMMAHQAMVKADLNLVAKIIREAIAYAGELGFKPHRDYRDAMLMLGDADPEACDEPIPLGKDDKPFFIAGPYDNVDRIMAKLERKLGPDGFHFLIPVSGDEEIFLEKFE
ncbi:MAG TPA: hypothetical protein EYP49_16275 [Anaerolineae bacterium]|nr:hypothetical protein [Anaerolineae bacterium]